MFQVDTVLLFLLLVVVSVFFFKQMHQHDSWVIHSIAGMCLMFNSLWVFLTSCNSISYVQMISAEAPVLFAKAAQIFITELTLRAWIHTEDNKRRTLQVRHAHRDAFLLYFLHFLHTLRVLPRLDNTSVEETSHSFQLICWNCPNPPV